MANNFQFKNQYPAYHIHNLKARMFWPLSVSKAFSPRDALPQLEKYYPKKSQQSHFQEQAKTLFILG